MAEQENFINGQLVTHEGSTGKSEEELDTVSQSAKEEHEAQLQELFDKMEVEDGADVQFPYLVMGAELYCSCGTHKRKLNLPECHGVYVSNHPIMAEEDCEVGDGKNIPSFGICQSEDNPVNKSFLEKAGDKIKEFFTGEDTGEDADKIMLKTEDGRNVKGYACIPCIVGKWKDVYETEKIARNGTDGTCGGDRMSALTQRSFLVCANGGLIQPLTSGQEEE